MVIPLCARFPHQKLQEGHTAENCSPNQEKRVGEVRGGGGGRARDGELRGLEGVKREGRPRPRWSRPPLVGWPVERVTKGERAPAGRRGRRSGLETGRAAVLQRRSSLDVAPLADGGACTPEGPIRRTREGGVNGSR
jgi:hypothetical protein